MAPSSDGEDLPEGSWEERSFRSSSDYHRDLHVEVDVEEVEDNILTVGFTQYDGLSKWQRSPSVSRWNARGGSYSCD